MLKHNIKIKVILQNNIKELISENAFNQQKIMIKIENYEEGSVYYWNQQTFYKRYALVEDLF